jgi:restriction system protein
MDIPSYNEIMLPMLQYLSDQKNHSYQKINEYLITFFKLTSEDIEQLTPKGTKRVFDSRCQWTRFYLTKSGLIKNSKRKSKITKEGTNFLKVHSTSINKTTLLEIPHFSEFIQKITFKAQENYKKNHEVS